MTEEEYDKLLGIETGGFGEWIYQTVHYNRYEATPYEALDKFFEEYQFTEKDRVVDFGCGRGRVAFYIHNHFHIPVTGVEVMEKTYEQAIRNKAAYMKLNQHIKAPIHFHHGAAEDYELEPADNRFYFFNPFSIQVFKEVVGNILGSVRENKRSVDIILYYPMQEYERFLKNSTPFRLIKQIRLPDKEDDYEKFLVYRYS